MMRAWTCTTFKGYYPVGVAAVVVAENEAVALHWLVEELKSQGLTGTKSNGEPLTNTDLKPLPIHGGRKVRILCADDRRGFIPKAPSSKITIQG